MVGDAASGVGLVLLVRQAEEEPAVRAVLVVRQGLVRPLRLGDGVGGYQPFDGIVDLGSAEKGAGLGLRFVVGKRSMSRKC